MRSRLMACLTVLVFAATTGLWGQSPAPQQKVPRFTGGVNIVLVDVTVRDKSGAIVKGLTQDDFQLVEDGKPQQVLTFTYEEIAVAATSMMTATMLSTAPAAKTDVPITIAAPSPAAARPPDDAPPVPMTSEDVAGHRVWVLLFDTSSMQPEDVTKAADAALKWADEKMSPADLVAVASIGSTLSILSDFTTDKAKVHAVLTAFSAADGIAPAAVDASTMSSDEATATATTDTTAVDASAQELDSFNNDMRLRGLKTICENLTAIQQKKAILYFSSGMARNGSDNQVEMRAAENACSRANTSINPIDSRGLQAVIAGGSARQGSRGGVGAFSGSNVASQFNALAAQQETLQALAADTGGTAFTDSNNFGEAFDKVTKDISAYYILGYASSNPNRDGRYRKITVRLKDKAADGRKVEAREGYYADRDFTHTANADRETLLQEQLMTQIPATDVPLFVTAGWFRLAVDKYYVPVSLAVPGSAVPPSKDKITLDVAGFIRDERGMPVGRIRDTLTVPPSGAEGLEGKQVLYQTGVTLPPGRFLMKIVVRENTTGQMGTFEMPVTVPELKTAPVKVSSVVLSTQLQSAVGRKTVSPLVRDGVEIVPNLTHVISRDQKLYFYYEVYDPTDNNGPLLRTSLAFYRGKVKVFETPVVERRAVDAADRHAALFQFEIPAASFKPGLYTCQVNIIDEVAGRFAFPRLEMYVR